MTVRLFDRPRGGNPGFFYLLFAGGRFVPIEVRLPFRPPVDRDAEDEITPATEPSPER